MRIPAGPATCKGGGKPRSGRKRRLRSLSGTQKTEYNLGMLANAQV